MTRTSKRQQWIFTKPCGCPVGVAEGYTADTEQEAMEHMYERPSEERDARRRGVTTKLISWEKYDTEYYEKMMPSYRCPH